MAPSYLSFGSELDGYTRLSTYQRKNLDHSRATTEAVGTILKEICKEEGLDVTLASKNLEAGLNSTLNGWCRPGRDTATGACQDMLTALQNHAWSKQKGKEVAT